MGGKEDSGDRQLFTKLCAPFILIYSVCMFQHSFANTHMHKHKTVLLSSLSCSRPSERQANLI